MPIITSQQLEETEAWKRLLFFMTEENIVLKNRLSCIVKNISAPALVTEMENFQTSFVNEDLLIELLRNDLSKLNLLFHAENKDTVKKKTDISWMLTAMRTNFIQAEKAFSKLRADFNLYVSGSVN